MDLMLPTGRIFHLGYVVPDMAKAMDDFGSMFNLTWTDPVWRTAHMRDAEHGVMDTDVGVVFSRTGPPHIELVAGASGTVWEATDRPVLHHIGIWAKDLAKDSSELERRGFPIVANGLDDDGRLARFTYHRNPFGPLLELNAPETRRSIEAWLRGDALDVAALDVAEVV
jgi:lactoylglutathione lyase